LFQTPAAPNSSCSKLYLLQTPAAPSSSCCKLQQVLRRVAASTGACSKLHSSGACKLQLLSKRSLLWRACLVGALLDAPGWVVGGGRWAVGGGATGWPDGPWPCRVQGPCSTGPGPWWVPKPPVCTAVPSGRGGRRQRRRDAGGRQRSRGNCAGVGYGGLRWAAVGRVCARPMSAGRLGLGTQGGRPFIYSIARCRVTWFRLGAWGPAAQPFFLYACIYTHLQCADRKYARLPNHEGGAQPVAWSCSRPFYKLYNS
jgi:hypothetical protein